MIDLVEAANDLARLLEARGLKHPKHAQHVAPARKRIEAVMAHYFERQRKAVLAAVKPHIKRQLEAHPVPVKEASTQAKSFASALLPRSLQPLSFAATRAEESEYNSAITDLISAAAKSLDASAAVGEDFAGQYLRSNSLSKLTGGLNNTSIDRLQNAIGDAWDKGGSYDQIVQAIQSKFEDFSDTRAGLIAQNEVSAAYNSARASIAESLGFDEKSSEVESGNPCEECIENEDEGWIDAGDEFPNGGDAPPFHVNCECVVNFRKSSESDDEEE